MNTDDAPKYAATTFGEKPALEDEYNLTWIWIRLVL